MPIYISYHIHVSTKNTNMSSQYNIHFRWWLTCRASLGCLVTQTTMREKALPKQTCYGNHWYLHGLTANITCKYLILTEKKIWPGTVWPKSFMLNTSFSGGLFCSHCLFVCLFCCFTSQVNSYGHCGTVSSSSHTFSWASLNKQLTSTSCTYFRL